MPAAELAARLAEAYRLIGELTARVEHLERQVRKDSSTSSRRPSSDSPYKKDRDRSLRERGKRRPGKQPGDPARSSSEANSSSDPTDQEVISKSRDTPIHRSPMSSTGTPSQSQHNEPTEWAIQ